METLSDYLHAYAQWQKDILLVQNFGNGYGKRVTYNSPHYVPNEHYNHRNILDNELVIEFDDEDATTNGNNAGVVANNLKKNGMVFQAWSSGNKSVHVHAFFDTKDAVDIKLLKRLLIEWLCVGTTARPDYQLAVRRHLIRAEHGFHEKSGKYKTLLFTTVGYPRLNEVPQHVWDSYNRLLAVREDKKASVVTPDHPYVRKILQSTKITDNRQALLYRLVHVLKQKYTKEQVKELLIGWYFANNGKKLSRRRVAELVDYHWERSYSRITEHFFKQALIDSGENIEEVNK